MGGNWYHTIVHVSRPQVNPGAVKLVAERGLGLGDLSKIKVLGEPIDAVKRKFELRVEELEDPSFFNQHT